MNRKLWTATSLVASLAGRSNRKKAIKKINKLNSERKNIRRLGKIDINTILPIQANLGNVCISGGTQEVRNELIMQNCRQSISSGSPIVIIHEGNYQLESLLQNAFSNHHYLRLINYSNPYYDPIFRLSDVEIGHFLSSASMKGCELGTEGALYLKVMSIILRKKGITPYLRMLASCPHNSINEMIDTLEQNGSVSKVEADTLKNDIFISGGARANIEYLFQQIDMESTILAWKSNLSRCTSIEECILRNGIISIDVTSSIKTNQMALIATEIIRCAKIGTPFRVIVDAATIANNEKLVDVLKNSSNTVAWTISTSDLNRMIGNVNGELAIWLALSHRAILFSQSIKTCELISDELGEYEHIDIIESKSGNNNIGTFGYHYNANSGFSTYSNRKKVIEPKEIETLEDRGFFMLDNHTSTVCKGILN